MSEDAYIEYELLKKKYELEHKRASVVSIFFLQFVFLIKSCKEISDHNVGNTKILENIFLVE